MDWFGSICNKIQSVVDDIPFEESFNYIEEQLLALGEKVQLFCSDVVKDVLTPDMLDSVNEEDNNLVLEQNRNTDLASHEESNTDVGIDPEEPLLCDINTSSYTSLVEPIEENNVDSSLTKNADNEVHEDSNVGVKADISSAQLSSANSVNLSESAEIKFPDKEGSSVTGRSSFGFDLDVPKYPSSLDPTYCGISNKPSAEERLLFDDLKAYESCALRHRNAIGPTDYSEKILARVEKHKQEGVSRLKMVLEKMGRDGLAYCSEDDVDPESTLNDWEII